MFRCDLCNSAVGPNQPANKLVTKRRDTRYNCKPSKRNNNGVSTGWEIVEELSVCPECYEAKAGAPAQRAIEAINATENLSKREQFPRAPRFQKKRPNVEIVNTRLAHKVNKGAPNDSPSR